MTNEEKLLRENIRKIIDIVRTRKLNDKKQSIKQITRIAVPCHSSLSGH